MTGSYSLELSWPPASISHSLGPETDGAGRSLFVTRVGVSEAGEVRRFPAMKGCFLKKKSRRGLSLVTAVVALVARPDLSTWPHSTQQQ